MRRREFITGLGSAAAWPLPARAQQPASPVIGFLSNVMPYLPGFRRGLSDTGYVEGRNLTVEYRRAEARSDRLPGMAAELVRHNVAVIVAGGIPAARAAKAATTTIPVVFFTGGNPVSEGLVTSFTKPGGNLTGVTNFSGELAVKRIGFLLELLPSAMLVAVLVNTSNTLTESTSSDLEAAAAGVGVKLQFLRAGSEGELDPAFESAVENQAAALVVAADPFFIRRREQIIGLAARHKIPAIYSVRDFAQAGGLMSYANDALVMYRQAGVYAGRILKGEKPADLPIVQPTKFELIINLRTAKALRLEVPRSLLTAADAVVE